MSTKSAFFKENVFIQFAHTYGYIKSGNNKIRDVSGEVKRTPGSPLSQKRKKDYILILKNTQKTEQLNNRETMIQ